MSKNTPSRRTWLLFILLVLLAVYANEILQERQRTEEEERLRKMDIAICGDVARHRDPKNDPMSARIAISIGNTLLRSHDSKLRIRGMEYLKMGMCLDPEILEEHFKKHQLSRM